MEGKVEISVTDFLRLMDSEKAIKELEEVITKLRDSNERVTKDITEDILYLTEISKHNLMLDTSKLKNLKFSKIGRIGKDFTCFVPQI